MPRRRFTPRERNPGINWTGGWVGLRAGLGKEVRGKILCLCRGSNPDSPVVQSVVRRYSDWATSAPIPAFTCRKWEKSRKPSVRIFGFVTSNRTNSIWSVTDNSGAFAMVCRFYLIRMARLTSDVSHGLPNEGYVSDSLRTSYLGSSHPLISPRQNARGSAYAIFNRIWNVSDFSTSPPCRLNGGSGTDLLFWRSWRTHLLW
jgi:hypothetical protein